MYRLNPATGQRWRKGEVREDGMVFRNYTKTRPTKDGYYRMCFAEPVKMALSVKRAAKARYAKHQAFIDDIKRSMGGCIDCGFNGHPAALDFDHLPGTTKLFNIGQEKNRPRAQLMEEIAKCELVCANCHRIRTVNRHGSLKPNQSSIA